MSRFLEWLIVALLCGLVAAGAFAMTANPLRPLSIVEASFWLVAGIILAAAIASSLVLVDLKRAFGGAVAISIFAAVFYGLALWSPAAQLGHYSTHLLNYAMVQAVPVFVVTLVLAAIGALIGTFVNASVREFDL